MNNRDDIKNLAMQRLDEANVLFENGKCDGAFYLAGYSVELALKARICARFGIPNLFDDSNNQETFPGLREIKKMVKTHNLLILLVLSGLKTEFDLLKSTDRNMAKVNSLLFNAWSEGSRYKPCGHYSPDDVRDLINLLLADDSVLLWIENAN